MTATAMLLREAGWSITGTDTHCHPPTSTFLAEHGVRVGSEYDPANIPEGTDLVVAGGSAKVDPTQNREVAAAHERGIPVRAFPQVLAELSRSARNLVVAGSFGKSSCTALIAWILERAGKAPGFFIGAFPQQLRGPSSLGAGELFVLEGDEYLTSGLDRTSKFLYLEATDLLLTSLEHDHVNIFPTQEDYLVPFRELVRELPADGVLVGCSDDERVPELLKTAGCRVATYGLVDRFEPLWTARDVVVGETTRFDLVRGGARVARLTTSLLGRHNVQNIVGCSALLLERELVDLGQLQEAVASFRGLQRRLDLISEPGTPVSVYEGFGSSHAKATAAISAMREHFPGRRLVVGFEPHAFSWRHRRKVGWYRDAFEGADEVFVFQAPVLGSNREDELGPEEILAAVRERHPQARGLSTPEDGIEALEESLREGDVLLLLTSGDMGGLVSRIPRLVSRRFSS